MNSWLILAAITAFTVIGDYFIKMSSISAHGMVSAYFPLGLIFYGSTGIGWFFMMRSHSLAQIGVLYSAATLLLLAGLGVLVFKESFGLRDGIGIALALASVVVMGSKA